MIRIPFSFLISLFLVGCSISSTTDKSQEVALISESVEREMNRIIIDHTLGSYVLQTTSNNELVQKKNQGYETAFQLLVSEMKNIKKNENAIAPKRFSTFLKRLNDAPGCSEDLNVANLEKSYAAINKIDGNATYKNGMTQLLMLKAFDQKMDCLFNEVSV